MDASREPLAVRAAVVAVITAIVHLTVIAGWWQISADVEGQVALVIDLAGTAALVLWTRGKVTPVDEPRAADGTPLVLADNSLYQGGNYTGRHRDPDSPTQYDRLHDGEEG